MSSNKPNNELIINNERDPFEEIKKTSYELAES